MTYGSTSVSYSVNSQLHRQNHRISIGTYICESFVTIVTVWSTGSIHSDATWEHISFVYVYRWEEVTCAINIKFVYLYLTTYIYLALWLRCHGNHQIGPLEVQTIVVTDVTWPLPGVTIAMTTGPGGWSDQLWPCVVGPAAAARWPDPGRTHSGSDPVPEGAYPYTRWPLTTWLYIYVYIIYIHMYGWPQASGILVGYSVMMGTFLCSATRDDQVWCASAM